MMNKLYINSNTLSDEFNRALNVFRNSIKPSDKFEPVPKFDVNNLPTYSIISYDEYVEFLNSNCEVSVEHQVYPIITRSELRELIPLIWKGKEFTWKWKYTECGVDGYEVTSKGDRRFSPFYMISDGVSMESYYQKMKSISRDLIYNRYLTYLMDHLGLLAELIRIGQLMPYTDMFDKYGGQNKIYAKILNDKVNQVDNNLSFII